MKAKLPTKLLEPRRGGLQTDRWAWICLERCRRKAGLDELPLPIPVEDWIEGPLAIRLGFTDLSYLGQDVLGATHIAEREILIDEQVLSNEGRCRFTCAHELGHLTLHRNVRDAFYDVQADVTFSADKYERQADRFAAAFLMPMPVLERELIHELDAHGLKRAQCVYELMQPTVEAEWLWRYRVLPMVTRRFCVSLSAAVYRCADIQPLVDNAGPLLPRRLVERLLQRASQDDDVASVHVIEGVPQYRDLFSDAKDECPGE